MEDNQKYILQRKWKSKVPNSLQETLYLGYIDKNTISCVTDINKAIVMTKDECESWMMYLSEKASWSIMPAPEKEEQVESK